jgi:hypothetical protein
MDIVNGSGRSVPPPPPQLAGIVPSITGIGLPPPPLPQGVTDTVKNAFKKPIAAPLKPFVTEVAKSNRYLDFVRNQAATAVKKAIVGTSVPAAATQLNINDQYFTKKPQLYHDSAWNLPVVQAALAPLKESIDHAATLPVSETLIGQKRRMDSTGSTDIKPESTRVKTEPTPDPVPSAPFPPDQPSNFTGATYNEPGMQFKPLDSAAWDVNAQPMYSTAGSVSSAGSGSSNFDSWAW